MKLHFLDRSNYKDISFTIKKNSYPYFLRIWHYHAELELVYVTQSTGTRFIGDSIEPFREGEVVLIGKNLPHMWLNDEAYFEDAGVSIAEATAIHFRQDFLGKDFLEAPELKNIRDLIEESRYGLKFDNLDPKIKDSIQELDSGTQFERLMRFIHVLNQLANHESKTILSSEGYLASFKKTNNKNLDKIYEYIFSNFDKNILLSEVAEIANMNPSAFSRFFKRINRKTFKEYVNEVRIGYACKLLSEHQYNITRICYESGFNNISNFNRQFKKITGKSPSQYLQHHKKA
ncbi:MAG: AraC family transcriptional regulator [Allomuricauda sp.]